MSEERPDPEHSAPPLSTPERTNFFEGQVLGAEDLHREQEYHLGMRRLMNRFLHGQGVVSGLTVSNGDDPASIVVEPGLAVDAWGRGIVVPVPTTVDLGECEPGSFAVFVRYRESLTDLVPSPEGERAHAIAEGFEIVVGPAVPPSPPEPSAEPLVDLATVTLDRARGRVVVDPRTHRREMPGVGALLDRIRALEKRLGRRSPSAGDEP